MYATRECNTGIPGSRMIIVRYSIPVLGVLIPVFDIDNLIMSFILFYNIIGYSNIRRNKYGQKAYSKSVEEFENDDGSNDNGLTIKSEQNEILEIEHVELAPLIKKMRIIFRCFPTKNNKILQVVALCNI